MSGHLGLLLAGDWKQFEQFSSWSGTRLGVPVQGGVDCEQGESGPERRCTRYYERDRRRQYDGWNFFAGGFSRQLGVGQTGGTTGLPTHLDGANQFGLIAEAGYFVVPDTLEVFGRYEWLNLGGVYV